MSTKINLLTLLTLSFCSVVANRKALIIALIIPALAVAAIGVTHVYLWDYLINSSIISTEDMETAMNWYLCITVVTAFAKLSFIAMFAVSCHKIIVLGSHVSTGFLGFSANRRVFKYLLWTITFLIPVVVYQHFVVELIVSEYSYEESTFFGVAFLSFEGWSRLLTHWVPICIELGLLGVVGLVLPTIAIEGVSRVKPSLALAKGYFLVIFFSIAIVRAVEYILSFTFTDYVFPFFKLNDSVFVNYWFQVLLFALSVFQISVLSTFYRVKKSDNRE